MGLISAKGAQIIKINQIRNWGLGVQAKKSSAGGSRPGAGRPLNWGGRRPGAGRPRASAPLASPGRAAGLIYTKTKSPPPEWGDFSNMERPGRVLKSVAVAMPKESSTSPQLAAAKARYYLGLAPSESEAYAGMDRYYREYRRNFLVRGSINALAYWATKEGFEVLLEPAEALGEDQSRAVLDFINAINARVGLDQALFTAIVNALVFGRSAFEIERAGDGRPVRLLPLDSTSIEPHIDPESWELVAYDYQGRRDFYAPNEVLYFAYLDLDGSKRGLSGIEPILREAEVDSRIIREDILEAVTTLWAGIAIHTLQTDKLAPGTTQEQVQKIIDDHIAALRPGKHVATTDAWDIKVVDLKPDLTKLLEVSDKVERRILGNFGVPRFMLAIEKELNRATAYAELEAFVEGPVTFIQRWLRRELERQWYEPLLRLALGLDEEDELPVRAVHRWRQIRTADWFELVNAVSRAYMGGAGFIDRAKAYEMLRDGTATSFDPEELQKGEA